jgi:hypothetical protein
MTPPAADGARPANDGFAELADVLTWGGDSTATIATLQRRYVNCLSVCLGNKLGQLHALRPDMARQVLKALDQASNADLERALLLPATSRRMVTSLHDLNEVASHLVQVLPRPPAPDAHEHFLGWLLDSVSVFAEPRDEGMEAILLRIGRLFERVRPHCGPSLIYVSMVMRELRLQIDSDLEGFYSNSPQGLVGRAVLTNPHLDLVDDVMLIESVVHEATHGFVGMSEAIGLSGVDPAASWLLDRQPYDGLSRVVSPWTGKPLDIPTYLHACFVWWGLLHFWSDLSGAGVFDESRVRSRILRCAKGFRTAALIRELSPYRQIVQPALMECLNRLGRQVDAVLDDSGLEALVAEQRGR